MTASLTITYSDGSTKVISLGEKLVELDLPSHMRQSIAVNQTAMGEFRLSYSKPLMDGKSWSEITIRKDDASSAPATPSPVPGSS